MSHATGLPHNAGVSADPLVCNPRPDSTRMWIGDVPEAVTASQNPYRGRRSVSMHAEQV